MRRKCFVVGTAAICAFAVPIVFLVHFFPMRNWSSLTAKVAPAKTPSVAAPKRLDASGAQTPVVPLAFNSRSRPASATGHGQAATPADAAHDRFARWTELYFSASTAGDRAALVAQG